MRRPSACRGRRFAGSRPPPVSDLSGSFPGSGTAEAPYELNSAGDLKKLADLVAPGTLSLRDVHFKLTADITLPADWAGIGGLKPDTVDEGKGKNLAPFEGILDGGGHTLTYAEGGQNALLTYARRAEVKDLKIKAPCLADYALLSRYTVDYDTDGEYNTGVPETITLTNVTLLSGSVIEKGGAMPPV